MANKRLMTQEQYIENEGRKCPKCRSEDITGDPIEVSGGQGWNDCYCNECKYRWQEQWTLIKYVKEPQ
jgi:hypothetical protein